MGSGTLYRVDPVDVVASTTIRDNRVVAMHEVVRLPPGDRPVRISTTDNVKFTGTFLVVTRNGRVLLVDEGTKEVSVMLDMSARNTPDLVNGMGKAAVIHG